LVCAGGDNFRRCFGACDSTQRAAPAAYLNDCVS
jgi:hypothetical protein